MLGWSIIGIHAIDGAAPGGCAVVADPDAAGGDAEGHVRAITRIDADRRDAGVVEATAHPILAIGQVPQRLVDRPGVAVVFRQEERTGDGAAPDPAWLIGCAGLEAEEVGDARAFSAGLGERGRGDFLPGRALIARALKLDAEMAEGFGGEEGAVAWIGKQHGDGIAEEAGGSDRPLATRAAEFEQALPGADQQTVVHAMAP